MGLAETQARRHGTTYHVQVRACNVAGCGLWSRLSYRDAKGEAGQT